MVYMAMLILRIIDVAAPLHELSVAANAVRRQMAQHILPLSRFRLVHSQDVGGLHSVGEQFAHHGLAERHAIVDDAMLGRCAGCHGVVSVGLTPQEVLTEQRCTLDDGVRLVPEPFLVAAEGVDIIDLGGQPRPRHGREVPRHIAVAQRCCEAEGIGRDGGRPSPCAKVIACRYGTRLDQCAHIVDKRLRALLQTALHHRPVIHLDIDVVMVVGVPRSVRVGQPQSLQVGGQVAGARRRDEQVTAKLVVERLQIGVGHATAIVGQTVGSGLLQLRPRQRLVGVGAQRQADTREDRTIIGQMAPHQALVVQGLGGLQPTGGGLHRLHAHIGLRVVEIGIEVHLVVGVGREDKLHLIGALHLEALMAVAHHLATFVPHGDTHHHLHAIVGKIAHIEQLIGVDIACGALGLHAGHIFEQEVLLALLAGGEAHNEHILGMRAERFAHIAHTTGRETDTRQGRVE